MQSIRKAVIPAAGRGTRFLPATKTIPKEMLTVVDKPIIQYVVEETVDSGFTDVIFVTRERENIIENHFNHNEKLAKLLAQQPEKDLLKDVTHLSQMISMSSVVQSKPLGLGHAIQLTEPFLEGEPFGVLLGDEIIISDVPCMRQLIKVYETYGTSVVAVQKVDEHLVSNYGVILAEPVGKKEDRVLRVTDMVEKPSREAAPSNLAIVGRYILTPTVFHALKDLSPGTGGEIQLTDGLRALLKKETVHACLLEGSRHDVGSKLGYLIANVERALARKDLGLDFRNYLKKLRL